MRIRTIKPEFWTSNDIADLSLEDRLLFIGLWSYVDDHGRGRAEAHLIIAALFPRDMFANPRETVARVSRGLSHLSDAGLIHRYEVEGAPFFAVTAWTKHQRVDKPRPSRIPSPEEADTTTIPQNDANRETVAKESRNCREGVAKPLDTSAPGTGEQGNRGCTPYKSPKGDATVAAEMAHELSVMQPIITRILSERVRLTIFQASRSPVHFISLMLMPLYASFNRGMSVSRCTASSAKTGSGLCSVIHA